MGRVSTDEESAEVVGDDAFDVDDLLRLEFVCWK